jgi:hypothetical protein
MSTASAAPAAPAAPAPPITIVTSADSKAIAAIEKLIGQKIEWLCVSEQIIVEERQHWLSLIYVTEDFSGEPRVMEPEKLPEFGWFALDALPEPLSRFARDAVAALRR